MVDSRNLDFTCAWTTLIRQPEGGMQLKSLDSVSTDIARGGKNQTPMDG